MKIIAKIIYRLTIALMIAGSVQTAAKEKYHCLHPMMNGISIFFTLIPYQHKLPMWNY